MEVGFPINGGVRKCEFPHASLCQVRISILGLGLGVWGRRGEESEGVVNCVCCLSVGRYECIRRVDSSAERQRI